MVMILDMSVCLTADLRRVVFLKPDNSEYEQRTGRYQLEVFGI